MNQITIEDLLKAGVHFGHPTSRWNPNYRPFIAMKKNGIHIIDLEKTQRQMEVVGNELGRIVRNGGNVLFVGTKKQAKDIIQKGADRCGMYYVVERWLGGTLTNFITIKKSIKRLLMLEKESSEIYQSLTKKELSLLERERIRLADLHRGIKDMKHLPEAVFFVDAIHEKTAIREAQRLGIPLFGIVDSNSDPTEIEFPIPANDDSLRSIQLIVNYIVDVIITARGGVVEDTLEEEPKPAEPAVETAAPVVEEPAKPEPKPEPEPEPEAIKEETDKAEPAVEPKEQKDA